MCLLCLWKSVSFSHSFPPYCLFVEESGSFGLSDFPMLDLASFPCHWKWSLWLVFPVSRQIGGWGDSEYFLVRMIRRGSWGAPSGPLVPLSLLYDIGIDQWVQTLWVWWPIIKFPISCLPNDFSRHWWSMPRPTILFGLQNGDFLFSIFPSAFNS